MQSVLLDSLSIGTIETASRDRQKAGGVGGLAALAPVRAHSQGGLHFLLTMY